MIEKKCIKCGKTKKYELFTKEKRSKLGISSTCKECANRINRDKRYEKNKDKIQERKHLDKNKERRCKYCNKIKHHSLFTKHKNCEYGILCVCIKCSSARITQWRIKNKAKVIRSVNKYKYNNRDMIRKTNSRYEQKNRDKINKRIRLRRDTDSNFHIRGVLRSRMEHAFNSQNALKRYETLDLIGCSINELRDYLESLFISGMTWDNYGYYGWHIDHIKPCATFDLTDQEDQKQCFHYSNLQPLWKKDNLKKSDKWDGE